MTPLSALHLFKLWYFSLFLVVIMKSLEGKYEGLIWDLDSVRHPSNAKCFLKLEQLIIDLVSARCYFGNC